VIATLDELKVNLGHTSSADDVMLEGILAGVETRVASYTGRSFEPSPQLAGDDTDTLPPVTETVLLRTRPCDWWIPPASYNAPVTVDIPDARQVTGVLAQGEAISGWELVRQPGRPVFERIKLFDPNIDVRQFTSIPSIQLTGRFGWWPAPADLKDAVLIMASRRFYERAARYGDSVMLQDGATVNYFRQFSPSVQATLDSYRRRVRLP